MNYNIARAKHLDCGVLKKLSAKQISAAVKHFFEEMQEVGARTGINEEVRMCKRKRPVISITGLVDLIQFYFFFFGDSIMII